MTAVTDNDELRLWASISLANALGDDVSRPLRQMSDQELRFLASSIALHAIILPRYLDQWDLEPMEGQGFWTGTVLPAIRNELERRQCPKPEYGPTSPLAQIKRLDIADVASKFTKLTGRGNRLKGRCPMHHERTPSFYVFLDSQKWRCYGGCADYGDVVDLLTKLQKLGKLR